MKTFKTEQEAKKYSKKNPTETVECKSYHSNGQLSYHCFYVNGNIHGEFKTYEYNGQHSVHCFYVDGIRNGECKLYHYNGKLRSHYFYVDGIRNGECKSYHCNGELWVHFFYVNGERLDVDHLRDGSYKSLCVKHTLFDGNLIDENI